jgi:hypothetical protein
MRPKTEPEFPPILLRRRYVSSEQMPPKSKGRIRLNSAISCSSPKDNLQANALVAAMQDTGWQFSFPSGIAANTCAASNFTPSRFAFVVDRIRYMIALRCISLPPRKARRERSDPAKTSRIRVEEDHNAEEIVGDRGDILRQFMCQGWNCVDRLCRCPGATSN